MNDVNRDKELKDKYAKMFIAMSTDFLMRGITWETYVRNTEIAEKNMRQLPSVGSAEGSSGTKTSQ